MIEKVKTTLKAKLGNVGIQKIKNLLNLLKTPTICFRHIRTMITWRSKVKALSKRHEGLWVHLGCGDQHFEGMINCDVRVTRTTDLIMNCQNLSKFADNSINVIFSHAFFEHLYPYQQFPLLKDCYRTLNNDNGCLSCLMFLGIPDFHRIAESYLNRVPGHPGRSTIFDLSQVYRYTHGVPEIPYSSYLEQLHKSLFDKAYLSEVISNAGFKHWCIFNYCYKGEKIPLNIGMLCWKKKPSNHITSLKKMVNAFDKYFDDENEPLKSDRLIIHSS